MIAILYRWKLHPGREDDFRVAWAEMTEALGERGSLGSALFQDDDDIYYGFARWPDDATRDTAFEDNLLPDAQQRMRDAVADSLPPIRLSELANLWKRDC